MKYTDEDCKRTLEGDEYSLNSYVLFEDNNNPKIFMISLISNGILYDQMIEDDALAIACKDYLEKNGVRKYRSLQEFREKNPKVRC